MPTVQKTIQSAVLLCIDNNEEILECEKAFLETFGYTVLTARRLQVRSKNKGTRSIDETGSRWHPGGPDAGAICWNHWTVSVP